MPLADGRRLLEQLPDAAQVPVGWVRAQLGDGDPPGVGRASENAAVATWRERLWAAPDATRLGVDELSEAIGRPKSWIYRHTSTKSGLELLPHRRLDGALVFLVSEIRAWIRKHEEVVVRPAAPEDVIPIDRHQIATRRAPS